MTAGFIAIAGLVDDGGRALSGRVRALDEAQAAARAGAQQINVTLLRETVRLSSTLRQRSKQRTSTSRPLAMPEW